MAHCVERRFPPDQVDLLLDRWTQLLRAPHDEDSKPDAGRREFVPENRKSLLKTHRRDIGRSKPLRSIASFVSDALHQAQSAAERGLTGRIRGRLLRCVVELQRHAEKTLEQGFVQLACDARPLPKPLLQAEA